MSKILDISDIDKNEIRGYPNRMRSLLALLSLLAAAPLNAQLSEDAIPDAKPVAVAASAKPKSCTDGITVKRPGKFCESLEDCVTFCSCACDFDAAKWDPKAKKDGSVTCPRMPLEGQGMIPDKSPELADVPHDMTYVTANDKVRATKDTIAALKRLDAQLASSPARAEHDFTLHVGNCFRPQEYDSLRECRYVLGYSYEAEQAEDETTKAQHLWSANPNNQGLTWPGATPHSAGFACDIVLRDSKEADCFGCQAGTKKSPTCSIEAKLASRLADEVITSTTVGASRLTFEAWHYAWGRMSSYDSLCQAPDCQDKYWPITCRPGNR